MPRAPTHTYGCMLKSLGVCQCHAMLSASWTTHEITAVCLCDVVLSSSSSCSTHSCLLIQPSDFLQLGRTAPYFFIASLWTSRFVWLDHVAYIHLCCTLHSVAVTRIWCVQFKFKTDCNIFLSNIFWCFLLPWQCGGSTTILQPCCECNQLLPVKGPGLQV